MLGFAELVLENVLGILERPGIFLTLVSVHVDLGSKLWFQFQVTITAPQYHLHYVYKAEYCIAPLASHSLHCESHYFAFQLSSVVLRCSLMDFNVLILLIEVKKLVKTLVCFCCLIFWIFLLQYFLSVSSMSVSVNNIAYIRPYFHDCWHTDLIV